MWAVEKMGVPMLTLQIWWLQIPPLIVFVVDFCSIFLNLQSQNKNYAQNANIVSTLGYRGTFFTVCYNKRLLQLCTFSFKLFPRLPNPKQFFFQMTFSIFFTISNGENLPIFCLHEVWCEKVVSPRLILRQGNILVLRRLSHITPNFSIGIIWEFTTIKVKITPVNPLQVFLNSLLNK